MHRSLECNTTASAVVKKQLVGHTAAHGASVQCMHAIDTERSPGLPSLSVTTRRRLMPHGTSCSFLHAVTHALHSMQRSASQRNFTRAIGTSRRPDLAEGALGFLHSGHWVEAVGCHCVRTFAKHDGVGARGVLTPHVRSLVPAREMERHKCNTWPDPVGDQRLDFHTGVVLRA